MLARGSFDPHIFVMIIRRLTDHFSLRDYDRAKDEISEEIVRRQSRGSVMAQDGEAMTGDELLAQSRLADKALEAARRALSR